MTSLPIKNFNKRSSNYRIALETEGEGGHESKDDKMGGAHKLMTFPLETKLMQMSYEKG